MFKALSRFEIEYVFFVSKVDGSYDQPVREAVDYAERYPWDSSFGREPSICIRGVLFEGGLAACKAPCPFLLREVISLPHLAFI